MYINTIYVGQVALARALAISFTAERRAHAGAPPARTPGGSVRTGSSWPGGQLGKRTQIQVR